MTALTIVVAADLAGGVAYEVIDEAGRPVLRRATWRAAAQALARHAGRGQAARDDDDRRPAEVPAECWSLCNFGGR